MQNKLCPLLQQLLSRVNFFLKKTRPEEMPGLGDRSLLFLHIPKTAGSSFRDLLRRRFLPESVLSLDEERIKSIDEVLPILNRYRLVQGHLPYESVNHFAKRPFVFTILRDPIDRAISTFYFMKRRVSLLKTPGNDDRFKIKRIKELKSVESMTLLEFIRREPQAAARRLGNLQVEFLTIPCHQYKRALEPSISERELALAKERLSNCDAFGLVERLPETSEYLAYKLQARPFDKMAWLNQTRSRPRLDQIDPEVKAELEELTRYDRQLYAFAAELFEQRRAEMLRELLTWHAGLRYAKNEPTREMAPSFIAGTSLPGEGWYAPETDGTHWYNWTGPETDSWVELASPVGKKYTLKLGVLHALRPESLTELELSVNGARLLHETRPHPPGYMIYAEVPATLLRGKGRKNRIALHVPHPTRPCDSDPLNDDSRLLGISVYHIALTAGC